MNIVRTNSVLGSVWTIRDGAGRVGTIFQAEQEEGVFRARRFRGNAERDFGDLGGAVAFLEGSGRVEKEVEKSV